MGYVVQTDKILFSNSGGTGTFQDAVNQAQTKQLPLFVAPGAYKVGAIVISAPVEIYATPGTATLISASATNSFTFDIRSKVSGASIANVILRGLTFWGENKPFATSISSRYVLGYFANMGNFNALISAFKVTGLIIEDCQIGGSSSAGLAMWGCTAEIRNNDMSGNTVVGIYACDGWASLISDNFVRDSKNEGIFITRTNAGFDGTIIRGNRIHATGATWNAKSGQVSSSGWLGNAIYGINANDLIISENVCLNSAFSGIRLFDCWNCNVSNNQIYASGECALFIEAPHEPSSGTAGNENPNRYEGGIVSGNTIVEAGNGINVANGWYGGQRVVVANNNVKSIADKKIVTNDPSYAVYNTGGGGISVENNCNVVGNIVEDCAGSGFGLGSASYVNSTVKTTVNATGNTTRNCRYGLSFMYGSPYGYTLISSNIIQNSSEAAIVPMTWDSQTGTWVRVTGSPDYGAQSNGLYTGKPYSNVMIGLNFAN